MNEGPLHAVLKARYALPTDRLEVPVGPFVADIVRHAEDGGDPLIIEIQTGSFGAMGDKLDRLLCEYRVQIVHPVALRTTLDRPPAAPRRSPQRGSIYAVFDELISIPTLLDHPNLVLDVVLVEVTKHQVRDRTARRRRGGWRTVARVLDRVVETIRLSDLADLGELLPAELAEEFTTADLASACGIGRDQAQRMAYCLRSAGLLAPVDRRSEGIVYTKAGSA